MTTTTYQLAQRTLIRAFRAGHYVLILAEGSLPTPGFDVDIVESPLRIFPPQFILLQYPRPGIWPQHVTPYRYSEPVPFPEDQEVITVHHAEGSDQVEIQDCGPELVSFARATAGDADRAVSPGVDEATGFSKKLSFEEAFANAVANLPPIEPPVADALSRVHVLEIGGLFGDAAEYMGWDATAVRIVTVLLFIPLHFTLILAYIILGLVLPKEPMPNYPPTPQYPND